MECLIGMHEMKKGRGMSTDFGIEHQIVQEKAAYLAAVRTRGAGKRIVVYGAGRYGRELAVRLAAHGIEVSGYAVTQAKYNQTQLRGLPVYALAELLPKKEQLLFLIGVKEAMQGDIEKNLQKSGVTDYLLPPVHFTEMIDGYFTRPVMEITPKAGCSVDCRYCPQNLFLRRYFAEDRQAEMTFDEFRMYLDKMPQDIVVDFAGFVEPLLAKDGLRMVQYAHESGHDVRLFTTLVGLDRASFREIEDIPFQLVVLHLPDVHQYANIPVTDAYLALLRDVVAKTRPNGDPFVDMANCQAEPDPRVVEIIGHQFPISWDLYDRAGNLSDEHLRSAKPHAEPIYCERSVRLDHNVLLPNGDVVLCCMDFGMTHVLGNLKRQSYDEIMQSEELARIVAANGREGDALCQKCTYAKEAGAIG